MLEAFLVPLHPGLHTLGLGENDSYTVREHGRLQERKNVERRLLHINIFIYILGFLSL